MGALLEQYKKDRDRLYSKVRNTISGTAYSILNDFVLNSVATKGQFLSAWNLSYGLPVFYSGFYDSINQYSDTQKSSGTVNTRQKDAISSNKGNLKGRRLQEDIFITNGANNFFYDNGQLLTKNYENVFMQKEEKIKISKGGKGSFATVGAGSWGKVSNTKYEDMGKIWNGFTTQCIKELKGL
jgi:hypothetical protein